MRLFGFRLLSDKKLAGILAEARKDERVGIRSDLQWAADHQDEIAQWGQDKGNLPVYNGWHGISVRYACAVIYQRQINEDALLNRE